MAERAPSHPTCAKAASFEASALEARTEMQKSHNETSVSPLLSLPPTHPITTSNVIHHLVFVAVRTEEQTGEINNNCGVTVWDAIRIQHGSKYKYKQTVFILLKDRSILTPSLPQELQMIELREEMNQR